MTKVKVKTNMFARTSHKKRLWHVTTLKHALGLYVVPFNDNLAAAFRVLPGQLLLELYAEQTPNGLIHVLFLYEGAIYTVHMALSLYEGTVPTPQLTKVEL